MPSIKKSAFHPGKDTSARAPRPETVETRRARGFFSDERGRDDRRNLDHLVGKPLEFFEQRRNEKTACARFIGAFYFEACAESRMRLEADTVSAQTESRPEPARLPAAVLLGMQPTRLPLQGEGDLMISDESKLRPAHPSR